MDVESDQRGPAAAMSSSEAVPEREREILIAVLESIETGVVACDADGVLTLFNRATREMHGIPEEELPPEEWAGRYDLFMQDGVTPMQTEQIPLLRALRGEWVREAEMVIAPKGRPPRSVICTGGPLQGSDGRPLGAVVAMHDVTERRLAERQLAHRSLHDPLTGLANRQLLVDRIEQALARRSRRGRLVAVLILGIDQFKAINDAYGHEVGDQVLVAVGGRLREALREEDTIARASEGVLAAPRDADMVGRLGGDEFVVVVEDLNDLADATTVSDRVLAHLRSPLLVGPHEMSLNASVGIALSSLRTDSTSSAAELLRDADTAMHAAKQAGGGGHELFGSQMRAELVARTELIRDLRAAVSEGQLRLLYQPQVDVASGLMTGVEALVRWQHPDRGLLTPDRFLPVAESVGLIAAIDDWVMEEACAQLAAWDLAGLTELQMAVNVSAGRLVAGRLADRIAALVRSTGIAPERLEIEITETVAVDNDDAAVTAITEIRELGVRVAIDDFGMGHSALSRLQKFPVDRLKIDRAFVSPLTDHDARGSIADAMIAIGQSLGLDVVAEGVETREHLDALRTLGCRSAQGYLFSRPVSAQALAGLARSGFAHAVSGDEPAVADSEHARQSAGRQERLIRTLLGELQRVTGLETTYLTTIDWDEEMQHITHARNTGTIEIPEGLAVEWSSTVCRRALERGVPYTDDLPATFPDVPAGRELGLKTYISVPLLDGGGALQGTLCGASSKRVSLGPEALRVMDRFARLITRGMAAEPLDHESL